MKCPYPWLVLAGTIVMLSIGMPAIGFAGQDISYQSPQIVFSDSDPASMSMPPEPSGEITLDIALNAAIHRHPSLSASLAEIDARKGAARQAGALPNPVLFGEVEQFGGSGDYAGTDAISSRLGIAQAFSLGGKISKQVNEAQTALKIAELEHRANIVAIIAQVEQRFLQVHTLQEQLRIQSEQLDIMERTHDVVSKKVKSGDASPLDIPRSQVELSTARIEIQRTRKAHKSARYALAESWGSLFPLFSSVSAQYEYADTLSEQELTQTLEQSPAWQLLAGQVTLADAAHKLARANAAPDIELGGGYQRFTETNDHAFFVELSIPIPVFDRNQGGVAEAAALRQKAGQDRNAGFLALRNQLQAAWRDVVAARQSVFSVDQQVYPAAQQSYESIRKAYQAGAVDIIGLLDAQRTWVETRALRLEMLNDLETGMIEIRRLTGERVRTIIERKNP
ncbi:MAG: TolC family protein [Desulfatitalea sp.]|nr:TolC family protein [Desulfatitalea sp.]NNK01155.1 TolC family protein [Desulfatitalea sp.]